jgi:hypothetical protein
MVPYLFAMRQMVQANNPTTEESMHHIYDSDYVEIDPSPLATQSKKFVAEEEARRAASPAGFYDRFCGENPSAPECKIYED